VRSRDVPNEVMSRRSFPDVKQGHIVPRVYQRAWANADDQVTVHVAGKLASFTMNTADAGTRRRPYTRFRPDGSRIDDMEATLAEVENRIKPTLTAIDQDPRLTRDRKGGLAQFIAVQMLRSPEFFRTRAKNVEDFINEHFVREHAKPALLERAGGDTDRARELAIELFQRETQALVSMSQLSLKVATILASMRWQLLQTSRPALIYSNQPVVLWPAGFGVMQSAPTRPRFGPMSAQEVLFPLAPRLALMMTWEDRPDRETPRPIGHDLAATINELVIGQADRQWMHAVDHEPARTSVPLRSVSTALGGSSAALATAGSSRLTHAQKFLRRYQKRRWPPHVELLWDDSPTVQIAPAA
jgi:hypothetical protein